MRSVTAEKMNRLGIHTGADLRNQSLEFLQHNFGKSGSWYYMISRGEDNRTVKPDRVRKSYGSETTFKEDLTDAAAIEKGVLAMMDDVWQWCNNTGNFGRTVTVKIKFADFQQVTRSRTAISLLTSEKTMQKFCIELTRSIFPLRTGIRLVGVTLSSFESKEQEQESQLFLI